MNASPQFNSDKAVVDGRLLGRSSKNDVGGGGEFPIKKIAFRQPPSVVVEDEKGGKNSIANSNKDDAALPIIVNGSKKDITLQSAEERERQKKEEELQDVIRRAREAGLHACELAWKGIVPGRISSDGENGVKMQPIVGSFGYNLTEECGGTTKFYEDPKEKKKKEKELKRKKKNAKRQVEDSFKASTLHSNDENENQHNGDVFVGRRDEEKEEERIPNGEEEDDITSSPFTYETPPTATTSRTTAFDNATTKSSGEESKSSKSSFFDPKRMFKRKTKKRKKKKVAREETSDDQALQEAKGLSGAVMCGICGTPFDTSENAIGHENICLIEWLKHDKLVRQAWRDEGNVKYSKNDVPIMFLEDEALPDYPEYLPPRTKGEIKLSSPSVRNYMLMTDQAMASVALRSKNILHEKVTQDLSALSLKKQKFEMNPTSAEEYTEHEGEMYRDLSIWMEEYDAMRELELASRDRHWYAYLEQRACERRYGTQPNLSHRDYYYHRLNRISASGSDAFDMPPPEEGTHSESEEERENFIAKSKIWGKVKGRFDHAYTLCKEGPTAPTAGMDHKSHRHARKDDKVGGGSDRGDMKHDTNTLFINVVVKNSVQVVNNELQRMAKGWWQSELQKKGADQDEVLDFQFEWIRGHTQKRVIQLAGMALASDFTPRKVAVQLSNDLYRLLEPNLKPKGVTIQTVIEYREGQYFVLAVNIVEIDWVLLMKWVAIQVNARNSALTLGQSRSYNKMKPNAAAKKKKKKVTIQQQAKNVLTSIKQRFPSKNEVIGYILFSMYSMHVYISVPLLRIWYIFFMRYAVDKFILNAVTDDIFRYVENKGMEMAMGIKNNNDQASFMLAALREIRSGGKKGQVEEDGEGDEEAKPIIPLMGPIIKSDNNVVQAPPNFSPPDILEFVGLETDLPVGFLRLRWAMLHKESSFLKEAFWADVMQYEKIEMQQWSSNENEIGLPSVSDGVDENSFLNATLEFSYLMPKSAFVKANMCYATFEIIHYDNYCLVIKEKTLTPEVPYGNTFIAWTQYTIVNTGKNTCRMTCSVEAEFPNGAPMVARQIKSGMRSGTAEKFVSFSETICRYAEAVP